MLRIQHEYIGNCYSQYSLCLMILRYTCTSPCFHNNSDILVTIQPPSSVNEFTMSVLPLLCIVMNNCYTWHQVVSLWQDIKYFHKRSQRKVTCCQWLCVLSQSSLFWSSLRRYVKPCFRCGVRIMLLELDQLKDLGSGPLWVQHLGIDLKQ